MFYLAKSCLFDASILTISCLYGAKDSSFLVSPTSVKLAGLYSRVSPHFVQVAMCTEDKTVFNELRSTSKVIVPLMRFFLEFTLNFSIFLH